MAAADRARFERELRDAIKLEMVLQDKLEITVLF